MSPRKQLNVKNTSKKQINYLQSLQQCASCLKDSSSSVRLDEVLTKFTRLKNLIKCDTVCDLITETRLNQMKNQTSLHFESRIKYLFSETEILLKELEEKDNCLQEKVLNNYTFAIKSVVWKIREITIPN
ncbi:8054_t:CDS:2 [Entrophospora sp. SA101]|nr:8054_t:CDS:2 [Entrophospora sp. SA101]